MKRPFKVGDITRSINSRWPLLNHRLVRIDAIAPLPRYAGKPYWISRVDGEDWCFPVRCGDGRIRFYTGQRVWCDASQLMPIEDDGDPAAEREREALLTEAQ